MSVLGFAKNGCLIEKYKKSLAKEHIQNYFENMEKLGFSKEEALNYLKGDKK